jgi:two-component system chemotaxis sensor kinase CheA
MDVVKRNLEKINGKVDIMSWPGRGSTFIFKIPLTLALMDGMVVKVGKARYIIPLISIRESIRPESDMITVTMDGQEIVSLRNELIPVLRLHQLQNIEPDAEHLEDGLLIIIEHRGKSFAIAVDTITGQQQTVIKGLSDYMGNVRGVSGCTILGDGQVSLIIDVGTLIDVFIEQDSLIENVADMNIETEKEEKVSK